MRLLIITALMIILLVAFPISAFALEEGLPSDELVSIDDSPNAVEVETIKTIDIFGFTVVIAPADDENPISIAVYKTDDENQEEEPEPITCFILGDKLGQSVSTLAQSVPGSPEHGKIVSTFVKEVNTQRKEQKKIEKELKKEEKNSDITIDEDDESSNSNLNRSNKKNKNKNKNKNKK